jgi:hypothetical protein
MFKIITLKKNSNLNLIIFTKKFITHVQEKAFNLGCNFNNRGTI